MKKTLIRAIALTLCAVTLVFTLVSCGGIKSGKYRNYLLGSDTTYGEYEFKGLNKFTYSSYVAGNKVDSASTSGTYKVDGDQITFTWKSGDEEKTDTQTFEKTENGIKIGLVEYTLVKD